MSMPDEQDGIIVCHPDVSDNTGDYRQEGLEQLYALENSHFWFMARKEVIVREVTLRHTLQDELIEIGAGTGNVAREILALGYNLSVGDIHMNGLRYARGYGVSTCYQFDIYRSEFTSMFNGVLMFDVLEHLEDDVAALRSACRMLKPGGKITLTVPAHMLLWSRVDFLSGHKRRYNLQTIEAVLGAAGFNVISSRYFFRFLVPIMFFGRLFKHDSGCPATESELEALQLEAAPASLNVLVRQVLRADSRWLGFLDKCFGSSIIVTAIKKPA